MDQKSKFYRDAKHILNNNNQEPFSDEDINQIIQLLEVFTNVVYNNFRNQNQANKNGECNTIY